MLLLRMRPARCFGGLSQVSRALYMPPGAMLPLPGRALPRTRLEWDTVPGFGDVVRFSRDCRVR